MIGERRTRKLGVLNADENSFSIAQIHMAVEPYIQILVLLGNTMVGNYLIALWHALERNSTLNPSMSSHVVGVSGQSLLLCTCCKHI